jgi:hypothetical protein
VVPPHVVKSRVCQRRQHRSRVDRFRERLRCAAPRTLDARHDPDPLCGYVWEHATRRSRHGKPCFHADVGTLGRRVPGTHGPHLFFSDWTFDFAEFVTSFAHRALPPYPPLQRLRYPPLQLQLTTLLPSPPCQLQPRIILRDFANGYLVAEILNRFFPNDVSMHSFDKNASSVHKKRDNWGLLLKAIKRLNVMAVTTREWEAVCASEDGAAVDFAGRLHGKLSGPGNFRPESSGAARESARVANEFSGVNNSSNAYSRDRREESHLQRGFVSDEGADGRGTDRGGSGTFNASVLRDNGGVEDRGGASSWDFPGGDSGGDHGGGRMTSFGCGYGNGFGGRDEPPPRFGGKDLETATAQYGASPAAPFRFQPHAGGNGFDWAAYQKVFMSPKQEDHGEGWIHEVGGGGDSSAGRSGGGGHHRHDEIREHSYDETSYDDDTDRGNAAVRVGPRGSGKRRPMRPLDGREGGVTSPFLGGRDDEASAFPSEPQSDGQHGHDRRDGYEQQQPRRQPARRDPPPRNFDGGASLLDWGPSLPGEDTYGDDSYGDDGYGDDDVYQSDPAYDGRVAVSNDQGYGNQTASRTNHNQPSPSPNRWDHDSGADRDRRERSYREASAAARPKVAVPKPKRRGDTAGDDTRRQPPIRPSSNSGTETDRRDSFNALEKPRGAAAGFYNPTFYEKKYDAGEARGVATYKQSGTGGYYGLSVAVSEAQLRARQEGPYAGQYGVDYEPKRASDYRRMLGEHGGYYKLGSLGGDLDTDEQIEARERREVIKELDRVNREQNRLAGERSQLVLAKKGVEKPPEELRRKGFLSHVGDRDPRNSNAEPSKHEKMWSYAKRFVPKPVQAACAKRVETAPPRVHGVWKHPADEPGDFAAPSENFRGEWPREWGGVAEVRGPHENAPRLDRGKRGVRLQPDAMHDRGAKREMSELEVLEMEHRIHQQKLRELSLA